MSLFSKLCGPRRSSVKKRTAERLGGTLVATRAGHTVVVTNAGGWNTILDVNANADGPPMMFLGPGHATRVAIPFVARDEFSMNARRSRMIGQAIYNERKHWHPNNPITWQDRFNELQPTLTPPTVDWGFGDFDYEFTITTNDEPRTRELLNDPKIREILQSEPGGELRVERVSYWLGTVAWKRTGDLGLLSFQETRVLDNIDRIARIHDLLDAILPRLISMGAANVIAPDIFTRSSDIDPPALHST